MGGWCGGLDMWPRPGGVGGAAVAHGWGGAAGSRSGSCINTCNITLQPAAACLGCNTVLTPCAMFGFWVRAAGTNLGGFMSPIVVGSLAKYYGWQWGMW